MTDTEDYKSYLMHYQIIKYVNFDDKKNNHIFTEMIENENRKSDFSIEFTGEIFRKLI